MKKKILTGNITPRSSRRNQARYRTRYYTIITLQYAYCAQHGMQQFVHYVFFFSFS